jgi:hypothetical protein
MKNCSYCGKEYPDDLETCSIDGSPLVISVPKPTMQAESIPVRQSSPVIRAAIVSGVILLLKGLQILSLPPGPARLLILAIALLASLFPIGVVALWAARRREPWSWLRVIVVTLSSYIGLGLLLLLLSFGLGTIAKVLHR